MEMLNFKIPVTLRDLLEINPEYYYIKEVIEINNMPTKLKEARQSYKENGVEFIMDYFNLYISVVLNKDEVREDLQVNAYEDLHKAMRDLDKCLTFILSDKETLNDECKLKYLNIIKMLIYAYVNIILTFNMKETLNKTFKKGRKALKLDSMKLDIEEIILRVNAVLHQEISIFWDSSVVEEPLINLIAEVCYHFIENPSIKSHKDICTQIFHLFGTLLTDYRYDTAFVSRLAELVKSHEHVVSVASEGIKLLVESYNTKSLVKQFVRQISEWQTDEKYQNSEASKNCANTLSEMSKLMPELMVEEVMSLVEYFSHATYTLRISVLNVITEILLTTLSKSNLTEDEMESRNDFLTILTEHILDVSPFVRTKAIQNWCRLQKENMITQEMQAHILQLIVYHIRDKASNVRKSAANCITSFLKHNPFSSELKLSNMKKLLEESKKNYEELKAKVFEPHFQNLKESQSTWDKIKNNIIEMLENNVNEDDDDDQNKEEFNLDKQQVANIVQAYLTDKKYYEAIKVTKKAVECIADFANLRENLEHKDENEFLLKLMNGFFMNIHNQLSDVMNADTEDAQKLNSLDKLVKYYENVVNFLEVLESSVEYMKDLLESTNISEMQEAVEFFICAYKFNIDNAVQGILEMLCIMQRPEQDRKVVVTKALQSIFLETNAKSMPEHSKIIVDRLIKFMTIIPSDKGDYFKAVMFIWVTDGALDNNIIECIFEYFVKKQNITEEESLKALQLLIMIAPAKKTIVTKNLHMIAELIFEKRGVNNMILLSETCALLMAGTIEQQKFSDKKPPFKLKPKDQIWKNLTNILYDNFDKKIYFYDRALKHAIRFIYTLCSKPDDICEQFTISVLKKIGMWAEPNAIKVEIFILTRLCNLLGEIAHCQLWFLDEIIYKEIKRRLYIATEEASNKQKKRRETNNITKDCSTATLSRKNATAVTDDCDESTLEGAQAVDAEADFILDVLETKIVTSETSLGVFTQLIVQICENPNKYNDESLQCSAVLALLRYMRVSSKFCGSYIRLILTLLEKSVFPDVKCSIIINCADLLERFPNVIEPWSVHLYNRLKDSEIKVQRTAFYTLANLLLKSMLRVNNNVSIMSTFISEGREELSDMSKQFFTALARRDNHLYNILPDVCSYLITRKDIEEERFKYIIKYLVSLITLATHSENLVDRLCIKFSGTEDIYVCRNIAFCLTLLTYNEKAVKKFMENFPYYKHLLHDEEIYATIKQIINSWSKIKPDVKALVAELEEKINDVFQIKENGDGGATPQISRPKRFSNKSKRQVQKRKHNKKIRIQTGSSSEDEDNFNASINSNVPVKRLTRTRVSQRNVCASDE